MRLILNDHLAIKKKLLVKKLQVAFRCDRECKNISDHIKKLIKKYNKNKKLLQRSY